MDLRESEITNMAESGRHPWEKARKEVVVSLINRFIPKIVKERNSILDIGCGDTWLIEQLSSDLKQSKFVAVDTAFTDELLEKYKSRLASSKFEVFPNLDEALNEREESADLVLLLDVIEHIEDDIEFLKWVQTFSKHINSETKFLITVPAFQSLFCQHDVFLGHYRRYNNKMLREHIESTGMQVERIGYFFFTLLPLRMLEVLKERLSKSKPEAIGVAAWKEKSTDAIIKTVLLIDYKISALLSKIGLKLPGLSNYVVCSPKRKES